MPDLQTFEAPILPESSDTISLFKPFVPPEATHQVVDTLSSRWVGQGPKTTLFEQQFLSIESQHPYSTAIAVGSGTDALHLSYILAGIGEGDEVIVPLFTCTATNIPLLYLKADLKFVDISIDSLNVDLDALESSITDKTKAIVLVHYGGLPIDLDRIASISSKYGIPVIQDGAHSFGLRWKGLPMSSYSRYTMYSFQAIKHITTGDGGMILISSDTHESLTAEYNLATRLRWFGIDRQKKQSGTWENDIKEVGYKYQMTDLGASLGLASLAYADSIIAHRTKLLTLYRDLLKGINGIEFFSGNPTPADQEYIHAAWLCTVLVDERRNLQAKLLASNIESNQVHYRNDRYSIFKQHLNANAHFPNMDMIEDKYLVLPLHMAMRESDVIRICETIKSGW